MSHARRQRGATLVEVLISIFIMAIGMLALLSLFPLGAIRMSQVMQDNRTKQTGDNAHALATAMNIPFDQQVAGGPGFTDYYQNLNSVNLPADPALLPASPADLSHPVFIDGLGYYTAAGAGLFQDWVVGIPAIRRRAPSFVSSVPTSVKWFAGLDDILFDTNGTAQLVAPATFRQNIDYSVAYLCKRPRAADPSMVNVSCVIYRNRPLVLLGGGLNESAYTADMDLNKGNVIRVSAAANATVNPSIPNAKIGDWLLDATPMVMYDTAGNRKYQTNMATFYRIVSVNDGVDINGQPLTEYEVHQSIRGYPPGYPFGANPPPGMYIPSNPNSIIFLEGVVDVFEKGLVRRRF
jgi:Prokaryotic N-terminal methylation motif